MKEKFLYDVKKKLKKDSNRSALMKHKDRKNYGEKQE